MRHHVVAGIFRPASPKSRLQFENISEEMMNQQSKKILFLDDDELALEVFSEFLEKNGFQILGASTLAEAEHILDTNWVHMMIVDLNLQPDDERDRSGLQIVENASYGIVPKVVLTGYDDDPQSMRRALRPRGQGVQAAVDYIGKNDSDRYELIVQAFDTHVKVNWSLQIEWLARLESSIPHLTSLTTDDKDRAYFAHRMEEIESLLRQLFFEEEQITIGRILTYHAGVVWLEVATRSKEGREGVYIIACGQRQNMGLQLEHYHKFIPQNNNSGNVNQTQVVETLRFSAALYECTACNVTDMLTLKDHYLRHTAEESIKALELLFGTTLAPWHGQGSQTEEIATLKGFYDIWNGQNEITLDEKEWPARIEKLCSQASAIMNIPNLSYSDDRLTLHLSDGTKETYPEPINFLSDSGTVLDLQAQFGTIFGHLQLNNILVDTAIRGAWLIDFSRVQRGPLLRDFVTLEASLKLELLFMVGMETWWRIEQQLLAVESLDEIIDVSAFGPEVQKVLQMIGKIRQQAQIVVGQNLRGYFAGLFIHAINRLARYDQEKHYLSHGVQYFIQYLLSAAMVSQYLEVPRQFEFHYDEGYVVVEGKEHTVTKQEGDLLKYMSDHTDQLCTYRDLLIASGEVMGDKYDEAWQEDLGRQRLNAAIRRLRQRIEPNPDQPRYIITVRGRGYKLETEKTSE